MWQAIGYFALNFVEPGRALGQSIKWVAETIGAASYDRWWIKKVWITTFNTHFRGI